jgi:electron transfer flavoprotein alpha subunit
MPRVGRAARRDADLRHLGKVVSPDTFERPIYAGNAIQTVQSKDAKKVITVRGSTFDKAGEGGSAAIEAVAGGDRIPACRASSARTCPNPNVLN